MSSERDSAQNPTAAIGGMLNAPGADGVTQLGALAAALGEETARADHWQRIVAAIVGKIGPVPVRPSEYHNARPDDIQQVHSLNVFGPDDPDAPITFVMPEHEGDHEGMVTRDPAVIEALKATAGDDLEVQARAVLTALGLPATTEW